MDAYSILLEVVKIKEARSILIEGFRGENETSNYIELSHKMT